MNSRILFSIVLCISVLFCSCDDNGIDLTIKPSSNITTKDISVADYTALDLSDQFEVFINYSETEESLTITANENLHKHIRAEKIGNTLEIEMKDRISYETPPTMKIHITTRTLNNFTASGVCLIELRDKLIAEDASIKLSGSCRLKGEFEVENLNIKNAGVSVVILEGSAKHLDITTSGTAKVEDYDLVCDYLKLKLAGTSKAFLTVNEEMEVTGSGTGILYYKGFPSKSTLKLAGTSEVIDMN